MAPSIGFTVSDNVSQRLKPSKCQQPAHFTGLTLIRQKRSGSQLAPVTVPYSNKHTSPSCLLNLKYNSWHTYACSYASLMNFVCLVYSGNFIDKVHLSSLSVGAVYFEYQDVYSSRLLTKTKRHKCELDLE